MSVPASTSKPATCKHILYPTCGCRPVQAVAETSPIAQPDNSTSFDNSDPEAPYGRKKDGTPYKNKPGGGRKAAPWSPEYRDPKTGEYPNRKVVPPRSVPIAQAPPPLPVSLLSPQEELALDAQDAVARAILAALESGDTDALDEYARALDAENCRNYFSEFCRQAWHVIEPSTTLVWGWHHELLCSVLQGIFETWHEAMISNGTKITPIKNTVINCPPNSLKSKLIAVFFPVWIWLRAPGAKLVCISVNEKATHRDARAGRDLIKSKWFQDSFSPTWSLKGDQDAISNYGNTGGGERLSIPSGSVTAGLRGDFLIGDDLNDPADTNVESEIAKVNDLWDSTQYSRTNDPLRSIRLTVQQRLRRNDHTGHIISKQGLWSPENPDGWLNVVLSAEFDERKFVMPEPLAQALRAKLGPDRDDWKLVLEDPRTELGQTIDPIRMPLSFLAAERVRFTGTGSFAGQMLQRPALVEGARIKRNYWGWFRLEKGVRPDIDELETGRPRPAHCLDTAPTLIKARHHSPGNWTFDWIVISIDPALKETKRGSCWGLLAIAGFSGRRYVLEARAHRGDILEIIEHLRQMILAWQPDKILIEDKAAGDEMRRRLVAAMSEDKEGQVMPMVALEMIKIGAAGKEERLDACLPAIANGLVSLLDGAPWLEQFVEQTSEFPFGDEDDLVDCLTQAMNYIPEHEEDSWPDL